MDRSLMDRSLTAVTTVLSSFQHIGPAPILEEVGVSRTHRAEAHKEASGLLREEQEQSFLCNEKILCKVRTASSIILSQLLSNNS